MITLQNEKPTLLTIFVEVNSPNILFKDFKGIYSEEYSMFTMDIDIETTPTEQSNFLRRRSSMATKPFVQKYFSKGTKKKPLSTRE